MKKLMSLLALASLVCSCETIDLPSDSNGSSDNQNLVNVNVQLTNNDFAVDLTRASNKTASQAGLTNITLKVINQTTKKDTTITQISDSTFFGNVSLKLPVGTYTFVAVANNGSVAASITSDSEASIPTADNLTFYSCTKEVTISGNTSQSVEMDMGLWKNCMFGVKILDTTPDDVTYLQLIVSPNDENATSYNFNPSTGLTTSTKRYVRTYAKTEGGRTTFSNLIFTRMFLLTSQETTLDVTINALSSSNEVLYTRTLKNVPFKQSHKTQATGSFFSASTSGAFSFDTSIETTTISLDN